MYVTEYTDNLPVLRLQINQPLTEPIRCIEVLEQSTGKSHIGRRKTGAQRYDFHSHTEVNNGPGHAAQITVHIRRKRNYLDQPIMKAALIANALGKISP